MRTALACAAALLAGVGSQDATESFDRDPGWDGHQNRAATPDPRTIRQDFGFSPDTRHAGGDAGEIGGLVTPAAEPAFYAKAIPERSLETPVSASGRLLYEKGAGNLLLGFFNAETINEWRTPNTLVARLNGRGDTFHAHVEYATRRWRAGAHVIGEYDRVKDRLHPVELPCGVPVDWSLAYDPAGEGGRGTLTLTLGGHRTVCALEPGHKADGATFNRFGILPVLKSADGPGRIWIDDLTIDGAREAFSRDPGWEGRDNRRTYVTSNVRPRFDFGYSPTRHAGGQKPGEIGGRIFRGDGRYPDRMAYYGARLAELTLTAPLRASGRLALRRGVSDSDTLIGFFHSAHSLQSGGTDAIGTPPDFLGLAIGGPSREGFFVVPSYRTHGTSRRIADRGPLILPDGASHAWSLDYDPAGGGTITLRVGAETVRLELEKGSAAEGAHFDRFGIITTHVDGNTQEVYLDDLTYTSKP